jgi:hypothetical protein
MTYGIPYRNSLYTCDHVGQPSNEFHKLTKLKKVLNDNMDYQHVHSFCGLQAQIASGESSHGFMKI